MTSVLFEIAIILLLLVTNGILAMAEMSLVSSRKARLKALADEGHAGAGRALLLAESPNQLLSTVQIGITLVGIVAGAAGGATLSGWLAALLVAGGMPAGYASSVAFAGVVVCISYLSLIIGELVPKRIALAAPEKIACILAGPMQKLALVARPAVRILGWSTDFALRVLGIKQDKSAQVTGEEVRMLMEEGSLAGVFHKAEPEMVESVLALDEMLAKEIMTPRPKVVFINREDSHEQVWQKIVASRHSNFPVYEGNRDNVVGVVSVKAIYANIAASLPVKIGDVMVEPLFVPSTQTVAQLLESFRKSRKHFAIVADEFGSVVGVVTLVDVLEAIVGDVPSLEERIRPEIRRREDGSWLADGAVDIETMEAAIPSLNLTGEEERSYQTLAGFILHRLGHIPSEGEVVAVPGWKLEVIDMDHPRIDKVLLLPTAKPAPGV